jgi:hypothetical protein
MKILDEAGAAVAALSGVKAQFIAAGWSEQGAEQMTIEMLRAAPRPTR